MGDPRYYDDEFMYNDEDDDLYDLYPDDFDVFGYMPTSEYYYEDDEKGRYP